MARRPRQAQPAAEPDYFQVLVDDLAEALDALPPEAWTERGSARSSGLPALAERVAALTAARASLREEDDERDTKRRSG